MNRAQTSVGSLKPTPQSSGPWRQAGSWPVGTALPHIPSRDATRTVTSVPKKPVSDHRSCIGRGQEGSATSCQQGSSQPQFPHLGQPLELL